jgi:hypothetical protein
MLVSNLQNMLEHKVVSCTRMRAYLAVVQEASNLGDVLESSVSNCHFGWG